MILWIRSMATLSWKLLSPGEEMSCTVSHMNCVDCSDESEAHEVRTVNRLLASVVKKCRVEKKRLRLTPNDMVSRTCLNMAIPSTDPYTTYQMAQKPLPGLEVHCVLTRLRQAATLQGSVTLLVLSSPKIIFVLSNSWKVPF